MNISDDFYHDSSNITSDKLDLTILLPILITFISIVMTIAISSNLYVIYAIIKYHSLHKASSYLIANLAVSDLLTAIIVLPPMVYSAIQGRPLFNDTFCQISAYVNYIIFGASLNATMTITMDRCIAVFWPFRYVRMTTSAKTTFMITTTWLFPSIVALLPLLSLQQYGLGRYRFTNNTFYCGIDLDDYQENHLFNLISAASILNSIVVVAIAYGLIFRVAYKKWAESYYHGLNFHKYRRDASLFKTVRTTALIVGTNIICWLPAVIRVLIYTLYPPNTAQNRVDIAGLIFVWLPYTNCALNPIIYITSNPRLRNLAIKEWRNWQMNIIYCKLLNYNQRNTKITPWYIQSEPYTSYNS